MFSCNSEVPNDVIDSRELEDVLYDLHIAQSLAQQQTLDSLAYYEAYYKEAVFAKHKINQQFFDHSMEWYSSHTNYLNEIYTNLSMRFGDNTDSETDLENNKKQNLYLTGDTVNIWKGAMSVLLSSQEKNYYIFEEKADSAIQSGDLLKWIFSVNWHYHDGDKRAVAIFVIKYDNDSLSVSQQFINSSGFQIISTHVGNRKIKNIKGFIYQNTTWSARPRLLSLSNIQLLRIHLHSKEVKKGKEQSIDSLRQREISPNMNLIDSIKREDSIKERSPHFR